MALRTTAHGAWCMARRERLVMNSTYKVVHEAHRQVPHLLWCIRRGPHHGGQCAWRTAHGIGCVVRGSWLLPRV
eukprot:350169-Chlamydomonas_euryale.AAC.1